jgi:hypothetical protein
MTTIWDWVNSISYTKNNLLDNNTDIKTYEPFIVNKALSYHLDTVLHANEMNMRHHLSKESQYLYYFYALRKRKRYATWTKKEKIQDLNYIKHYYKYNDEKAFEALKILSEEQIAYIKNKLEHCGIEND